MNTILTRKEIMPGVFINHLNEKKFKSSCISISLITQLDKESANMNALLPHVLRRGCTEYPDIEAISARLDELYGSDIDPSVRRIGELQCVGFFSSFAEGAYLPEGSDILRNIVSLTCDLLLHPVMEDGMLNSDYVQSEKEKLAELLKSRINDKRLYAVSRCIEEMCAYENYSAGRFKSADECENITAADLTEYYKSILSTSPIEIFYCGSESQEAVISAFKASLKGMKRSKINYDLGTDVRMNSLEDEPRYYEENLDVTQGKLVLGFRMGECMEDVNIPAILVFNCVYGSGVTSKLFVNVREKMSLCYYASSLIDRSKGVMFVSSGIDFDKFDLAKQEILNQLDEVRKGNVSDDEISFAKKGLTSDFISGCDNPQDLESFFFANAIDGTDYTPESLNEEISRVTKEDIIAIASSVELDLVYFLRKANEDN